MRYIVASSSLPIMMFVGSRKRPQCVSCAFWVPWPWQLCFVAFCPGPTNVNMIGCVSNRVCCVSSFEFLDTFRINQDSLSEKATSTNNGW